MKIILISVTYNSLYKTYCGQYKKCLLVHLYCTVSIHVFSLSLYHADEFRFDAQLLTFEQQII